MTKKRARPAPQRAAEFQPPESLRRQEPYIVGIGASAGGLDAFQRLLHHIPSNTGLAYVLVQHLDPTHKSLLPELLGRASATAVVQAVDGMRIEPNRAHVIPPNTTMTVADGHLRLITRAQGRGPHLPIDALLRSLAEAHGTNAVGVILSGTGSDGTRGIQAIKEAGGITVAQDGASALYPSMPQSAVDTGAVDFILTPEEIADQLTRLGSHFAQHPDDATRSSGAPLVREDEELRAILTLLHKRTGVNFQQYRRGTLQRRILRRMLVQRQDTRGGYLAYLRLNPAELDVLYDDLLIGVTRFFRDPEVFATLQTSAFPAMMHEHIRGTPVRMWVAGCASGEEAYSLAIALLEFLGEAAADVAIQIFGTDLRETSIVKARAGWYPASIAEHVSPDRLRRFFVARENGYQITKAVRDLCVFSRQNVVRDPPFSHLDLVSCRNVLIYLEPALQRRVFPIFRYALDQHGILVLGSAESADAGSELFEPLAKAQRIYRPRAIPTHPIDIGRALATLPTLEPGAGMGQPSRAPSAVPSPEQIAEAADRCLLAQSPPGVVIDEHLRILQFRGDTASVLTHVPGVASLELLKFARPELVMPLRAAVSVAQNSGKPVREEGITLVDGDVIRRVTIDVFPFRPSASAPCFVVTFTVVPVVTTERRRGAAYPPGDPIRERRQRGETRELAVMKRYLQGIVEQHEATVEELRAASEELQSSNEELQSTNEELETTKEEVQSTNEELTTLNEQLGIGNTDLAALSGDLANILASTTIPIVIVGADLRLRRFTPATERVMRVIASDVNRPLDDVRMRVAVPDLERQILKVIETLTLVEQEVRGDDGRWWALTIRPYQTIDHRVDGAVLVFADIDASKRYGERADEVSEARRQLLDVAEAGRTMAEEARKIAEIANKTKSNFLANMSHDLRTPLNAISGYTELLEQGLRGPVTEAQLVDFGRIKRSARYLLVLINDILNFAKLEAGHLDIHLSDVPVGALAAELHELITPQLRAQALQFERGDSEAVVRADPEKVRQILLNLLSNALKFTAPEGRIGIDYATTDDVVRIEVWDTGIGIAPAYIERIFEPFVQIDRKLTSQATDGVGLGLAISCELARAMKGDLTVHSSLGHGSRFTLTLPRVL